MLNANNDKNDNSYPEVLVSSASLLGPSEVLSVLTVSSMAMSLAELAIQVGDTAALFSLSLQSSQFMISGSIPSTYSTMAKGL